jgi:hypothetical protein
MYYRGDYYRGDYYRGDPGFFSFLGGLAKGALGSIPVVGPALSHIVGGIGSRAAAPSAAGAASAIVKAVPGKIINTVTAHPVLTAAGGAGLAGLAAGAGAKALMTPGVARRGFHISKKSGRLVRNRRMRVTNPKALRRAIRRATGFARMARRVLHFTSPKAPRGRAIFKARRRKK